ncbi:MAG: T9SS type A sorting domain-containing protein [Bacteroidota bacterium]
MRHLLLLWLFLGLSGGMYAQQVNSSCEASDSIRNLYQRDAALMALRTPPQGAHHRSFFPDSILEENILDALVAVYNAVELPPRDEVTTLYNIKINNYRFPEALKLRIDGNLDILPELGLEDFLLNVQSLDSLAQLYQLQLTDVQAEGEDYLVTLTLNKVLDVKALVALINDEIDGVEVIEELQATGTEYADIFYDSFSDYEELRYSLSWGSGCPDNCQKEHSWRFRIHADCSVEFIEQSGDPLFINDLESLLNIGIYPNPTADLVTVNLLGSPQLDLHVQLFTASGLLLHREVMPVDNGLINLSFSLRELPTGVYFLAFRNDRTQLTEKIVKR